MIFCATRPITEYSDTINGNSAGLYDYYKWNPALLNLILLTTIAGYDYEGETAKEVGKRVNNFNEEYNQRFMETLKCEVGGQSVEELLKTLSPIEIYNLFKAEDIDHLPICQHTGTEKILQLMMTRVTAWAVSYRGTVKQQGNVKTAAFGSSPELLGVTQEMVGFYEAFTEALTKIAV